MQRLIIIMFIFLSAIAFTGPYSSCANPSPALPALTESQQVSTPEEWEGEGALEEGEGALEEGEGALEVPTPEEWVPTPAQRACLTKALEALEGGALTESQEEIFRTKLRAGGVFKAYQIESLVSELRDIKGAPAQQVPTPAQQEWVPTQEQEDCLKTALEELGDGVSTPEDWEKFRTRLEGGDFSPEDITNIITITKEKKREQAQEDCWKKALRAIPGLKDNGGDPTPEQMALIDAARNECLGIELGEGEGAELGEGEGAVPAY